MAKLRLLKTGHGDLCLAEWDKNRPETDRRGRSRFAEHFTPGRLAFRLDGPGQTRPIRASTPPPRRSCSSRPSRGAERAAITGDADLR